MSREVAIRWAEGTDAMAAQEQEKIISVMVKDGWEVVGWGQTNKDGSTTGFMLYFGRERLAVPPVIEQAAKADLGVVTPNRKQRRRMGR